MKGKKMKSNRFTNYNYLQYVKSISPKTNEKRSLLRAFLVGGLICCIGQGIRYALEYGLNLKGDELSSYVSLILIFLGSLLTGLGVYDRIGKFAGGGSIVPITGFANSVVSPAIDSNAEGPILGIGAKIFTVAGPVLLYGTLAGAVYGVIYWAVGLF